MVMVLPLGIVSETQFKEAVYHKIKQQTLESQNTTILYYIILYYIIYIADDGNR